MEPSGKKQIKVTGIIFTVYGVYNLVCVVLLLAGVEWVYRLIYTGGFEQSLPDNPSMVFTLTSVSILLSSVLYLAAGIVGIRLCDRPEKGNTVRTFGMIMFILALIGLVGHLFSGRGILVVLLSAVEAAVWFIYYHGGKKNLEDFKKKQPTAV